MKIEIKNIKVRVVDKINTSSYTMEKSKKYRNRNDRRKWKQNKNEY